MSNSGGIPSLKVYVHLSNASRHGVATTGYCCVTITVQCIMFSGRAHVLMCWQRVLRVAQVCWCSNGVKLLTKGPRSHQQRRSQVEQLQTAKQGDSSSSSSSSSRGISHWCELRRAG
jgi:hypothetical protein